MSGGTRQQSSSNHIFAEFSGSGDEPIFEIPQPAPRFGCVSATLKSRVYVWGGKTEVGGTSHLRSLYILDTNSEKWQNCATSGLYPPGYMNCAAAQESGILYVYGGLDKDNKSTGSLHCLDLDSHIWKELAPYKQEGPKRKSSCGMVVLEDKVILFGGYFEDKCTNELHLFDFSAGIWTSPVKSGTVPPPCHSFSLTKVNSNTAILFGGYNEGIGASDQLYTMDLIELDWSKVHRKDGDDWPAQRYQHDGSCIAPDTNHTHILISGGRADSRIHEDIWILSITTMVWKKPEIQPHMQLKTWYCEIDRIKALELLSGKPNGSFLCRPSSKVTIHKHHMMEHTHTVDLVCSNVVHHLKVWHRNGKYGFGQYRMFDTIMDLILCFSENSLEVHNPILKTTLRYPVFE